MDSSMSPFTPWGEKKRTHVSRKGSDLSPLAKREEKSLNEADMWKA
jgi:hypothetical protein